MERTKIVREVYREYDGWALRDPHTSYHLDCQYVCADEMDHYFFIPPPVERGWVTLSCARSRPGKEWLRLKLTYRDTQFSRLGVRTLHVEPRPGSKGKYREVACYRVFANDIKEVGQRPAGGIWCWMKFDYES